MEKEIILPEETEVFDEEFPTKDLKRAARRKRAFTKGKKRYKIRAAKWSLYDKDITAPDNTEYFEEFEINKYNSIHALSDHNELHHLRDVYCTNEVWAKASVRKKNEAMLADLRAHREGLLDDLSEAV